MNREEYIKKIQDDLAKTIETINRIPVDLVINTADGLNITFEGMYHEMPVVLSKLRKVFGNYKLEYYFPNSGLLAIRYIFDDGLDIHFYCIDFDNALEKIGKGKCSLETRDTTESYIQCAV